VSGRPWAGAVAAFDVEAVRREFPVLRETVRGKALVYLDSAASAQKPQAVIDAERHVYERSYANIHRGVHHLSKLATDAYEGARAKVQRFLGAAESREIVLLRGTTEAVNLVAQSYGRRHVGAGDEVLITGLEHHSNIVPWQLLCEEKGASLRVAPIDDAGEVDMAAFERLLSPRTRIVSVSHVSNALGTINPVRRMGELAHAAGAVVMVDGAQAAPHLAVDVRAIGCDFYAFSGHKVYGPSGVGALYGRAALLEAMPPWQGGGDMIASVTFERSTWNELPYKFEAGTPNIAGTIALGAAIDWVDRVGIDAIAGDAAAGGDSRPADRRHRAPEDGGSLLRRRGRPPARRGDDPRPRGYRGANGPPLRTAGHGPLRPSRHHPGLAGVLQHAGGARRPRRRHPQSPGDLPVTAAGCERSGRDPGTAGAA
jgi:cysteine desulfurase/selenocysteine lyase